MALAWFKWLLSVCVGHQYRPEPLRCGVTSVVNKVGHLVFKRHSKSKAIILFTSVPTTLQLWQTSTNSTFNVRPVTSDSIQTTISWITLRVIESVMSNKLYLSSRNQMTQSRERLLLAELERCRMHLEKSNNEEQENDGPESPSPLDSLTCPYKPCSRNDPYTSRGNLARHFQTRTLPIQRWTPY